MKEVGSISLNTQLSTSRQIPLPDKKMSITHILLWVVLVCQLFTLSHAFSVQYPKGSHPMGIDIGHHHSHESITPKFVNPIGESADVSEHEHTQHAHTPAHPLLSSSFVSQFFQSGTLFETDKHYQNCLYSPPLPPPHLA